jgi:hypothetical protein
LNVSANWQPTVTNCSAKVQLSRLHRRLQSQSNDDADDADEARGDAHPATPAAPTPWRSSPGRLLGPHAHNRGTRCLLATRKDESMSQLDCDNALDCDKTRRSVETSTTKRSNPTKVGAEQAADMRQQQGIRASRPLEHRRSQARAATRRAAASPFAPGLLDASGRWHVVVRMVVRRR